MLWADDMELAIINGEYRTSLITIPENGRVPYSVLGKSLSDERVRLNQEGFDGPEQRDLSERCLAGLGSPPMSALPLQLPRVIVQTQDHVMMYMEDAAGLRIIPLDAPPAGNLPREFDGIPRGHWEGDTLVVESSHFRYDYPTRDLISSYMVVGADTRVTERFTRISDDALLYEFRVQDEALYTEPWSGEYAFRRIGGPSYSYECHEGNYSLPGILRGGQMQDASN
jgi:hypothetical protein